LSRDQERYRPRSHFHGARRGTLRSGDAFVPEAITHSIDGDTDDHE